MRYLARFGQISDVYCDSTRQSRLAGQRHGKRVAAELYCLLQQSPAWSSGKPSKNDESDFFTFKNQATGLGA